jgi:hypothetical protein
MALSDGRNLDMPSLLIGGEARRLRALQRKAARRRRTRSRGGPQSHREREAYARWPRYGLVRPVAARIGSIRPRPRSLRATARWWSRT